MRIWSIYRLLLLAPMILMNADRAVGVPVNFIAAGPATWNSDPNWDLGFVPIAAAQEEAVIGLTRSAFVDDSPFPVGGITINGGTLEIRGTGNLLATPNGSVTGNLTMSTLGTLTVLNSGTLSVQGMTTAALSTVTLGEIGGFGTATLNITGGTLGGLTRIIGSDVNFTSSGDLTFSSTSILRPVITGSAHSNIASNGVVEAGGVVRPEFNNFTPALNTAWNLVTGTSLEKKFTLDTSLLPGLARGTGVVLKHDATSATLEYINTLILQVDRGSGEVKLANVVGSPIAFDAYTITSPSGMLGGTWNSLEGTGTWEKADNVSSTRLTEFNPTGSSTINVGSSLSIGTPFTPTPPAAFGDVVGGDLTFQYSAAAIGPNPGFTVNGAVEFVGAHNNLVLTIDPNTGQATIQNESPFFDVAIDAYTITSANGRLKFTNGQWNSLDDQNFGDWEEADNVSATRVTEYNPDSQTAMPGGGTILNLGSLVEVSGGPISASEFTVHFSLVSESLEGDYNDDGVVNAADYVVWRDRLNSEASLPNDTTPGVGQDDYARWKQNFGAAGGSVGSSTIQGVVVIGPLPTLGSGAGTAVPEPSTLAGGIVLLLSSLLAGRNRLHSEIHGKEP